LGRYFVAEALRREGCHVELGDDHFLDQTDDPDWLTEIGRRGWVVLMKDKMVRWRPLEREALLAAGIRAFVLTSGNMSGPEMARVFVANLGRIVSLATTQRTPFIAGVSSTGVRLYELPERP
jgi:hypothetical protein